MPKASHYTVVVIGTGFGGTMTALPVAREFVRRNKGETVLMLERGTWWTTPVGTVQDKEVETYDLLLKNKQPVQYWSTPNHFIGFLDIFALLPRMVVHRRATLRTRHTFSQYTVWATSLCLKPLCRIT